jgi:hypothetical protein
MQTKNLLYVLGALVLILWTGQPVQAQSAGESPQQKNCPELWPVERQGKWGYIDKTGQLIIPFKFDAADDFSEGLAAAAIKEKTGYIDKTGKFVIRPRFVEGYPFSSGMALVIIHRFKKGMFYFNQYGYIDRSGKLVIRVREPLDSKSFRVSYQDKDLTFFEGMLQVTQNDKSGFMDKSGKMVIPPRYNAVGFFSEGLAAAKGKNDRYGFIDKTGKFAIPPQFRRVGDFSEGLAAVDLVDASWPGNLAYINKRGEMVIKSMSNFPFSPDRIEFDLHQYRFCGGVAQVSLGKEEDQDATGYINKEGKFIWPEVTTPKKELR